MDCGHGWRNENDCDVCRPSALVVAGLRGRISELEAALQGLMAAVGQPEDGGTDRDAWDAAVEALQATE